MRRFVIFGNSGSGKTTLAKALAEVHRLVHLDLDSIVWERGQIAVRRPTEAVMADLSDFLTKHDAWVIEGCYGDLVEAASIHSTDLVFLNPGVETCLANNEQRPWEPEKYASEEEQDEMFEALQAWVRDYYRRDGPWSYEAHRRLFDAHEGPKTEHRGARDEALHAFGTDR